MGKLETLRRELAALEQEAMDGDMDERRKLEVRNEMTRLRDRLREAELEALKVWER